MIFCRILLTGILFCGVLLSAPALFGQSFADVFSTWPSDLKVYGKQTAEKGNDEVEPAANAKLIERAVIRLIELQEKDGAWPYEGVYRVGGEIPVGYRVGGTAIACHALLSSPIKDRSQILEPVRRGIELVLQELEDRRMRVSTRNQYDVRVWGHIYALEMFCQLQRHSEFKEEARIVKPWITKLVEIVVEEELANGGWNYASRNRHACFVTSPAVQSLLSARELGETVPDDVFARSVSALLASRNKTGAYQYSGPVSGRGDLLPGSIARGAVSETTLMLLGKGSIEQVRDSINAFHEHWDELEKRRQKTGTHVPPYGVAPYYFYYGHRYLAQAILMLPEEEQLKEFERFEEVLLRTKEDDDTWNDRVFKRSKAFGTAMSLLALSRSGARLPKALK